MQHIDIFFSYAHEDEELMHAVRQQLVPFDRLGIISKWFDRKIPAGKIWSGQIDEHLSTAGVILLFASPAFFDSNYCYDIEMSEALRRHNQGDAVVIPVILRPCAWQKSPLGAIQAVPKDGKPITTWANKDEACLDAANQIVEVVLQLGKKGKDVASKQMPTTALGSPEKTTGKLALIAAARTQGRRICGCTDTGEIMLLKRNGLSAHHRWECPTCGRRESADDIPPHQF